MLKVFVDFDNTVTVGDLGDALFLHFGGEACAQYDAQYKDGLLTAKECLTKKCEACGFVDRSRLDDFLRSQRVDSTFSDFVRFCEGRRVTLAIVSDGLDYYIDTVLRQQGWEHVPSFSNAVRFAGTGDGVRMVPTFPHDDEVCTRCACCKRNIMLSHSGDEDILVYVGDGYSDRCPAGYADIVFAKGELQPYCQEENISYYEFRSFRDVQTRLETILGYARLRKRREAEKKRRALFMAG